MDGSVLFRADEFLAQVGFSDRERGDYLVVLNEFQRVADGNMTHFKRQFRFLLDGCGKKYTCSLNYVFNDLNYVSIQTETFFMNGRLKRRMFEKWNNALPDGWFLEISNYRGFYRLYLGRLQLLKRYLYQDSSIQAFDLPGCIGFKSEMDWRQFNWSLPEAEEVK